MPKDVIEIPRSLARLLAAEKDDFKQQDKYEDVQKLNRLMLRMLLKAEE
jgi:hypothetical protein